MRAHRLAAMLMAACCATAAPAKCLKPWTSMFVFGDSYSDSGAGYVDGNGPTAVAYMAQDLGIPFTYYGAPDMAGKGLNFAVSAARTGSDPGQEQTDKTGRYHGFLGRGMMLQVGQFETGVQQGSIHFDPGTTLFFLAGGLNDEHGLFRKTQDNLEAEIRRLYALGGRNFLIAVLPEAIPQFPAAKALNPALAVIPLELRASLPDAHVALAAWGRYMDAVIQNPAQYGITNVTDKCAGRALLDEDETPCASPNTYFFYHDGHPSTAVHRIVGGMLARDAKTVFADTRPPCEEGKSQ
jgi:cholinesterase